MDNRLNKVTPARQVITKDEHGRENGWLMELQKDGDKTLSYLTAIAPRGFKGYHLHRIREANYVCIKGKVKVVLYRWYGSWTSSYVILSAGDKLNIPTDIPTGLFNMGNEEAWVINYPSPAYDPSVMEQVEYTIEELCQGVKK
jgi:dTDP-4-dehydrorhamnose 3,5-epimerase